MGLEITMLPELNLPVLNAHKLKSQDLITLIQDHHPELTQRVLNHGALLFRGFNCISVQMFSDAITACNLGSRCDTQDYDLPRTILSDDIYTSSDLPGHIPLPLHHEKPRSINPPHHLYFCCAQPPEQKGGTLLANAASIWDAMPRDISRRIDAYGVIYKQFFHGNTWLANWLKKNLGEGSARRWQEYFGTQNRAEVENKLAAGLAQWKWIDKKDDLIVTQSLPGVLEHPENGNKCWFNSAAYLNYFDNLIYGSLSALHGLSYVAARYMMFQDIFPLVCHYGNGESFSKKDILRINEILQNHIKVMRWQAGDFMIVDNYTMMHGKQPHERQRLLYSCMTERL